MAQPHEPHHESDEPVPVVDDRVHNDTPTDDRPLHTVDDHASDNDEHRSHHGGRGHGGHRHDRGYHGHGRRRPKFLLWLPLILSTLAVIIAIVAFTVAVTKDGNGGKREGHGPRWSQGPGHGHGYHGGRGGYGGGYDGSGINPRGGNGGQLRVPGQTPQQGVAPGSTTDKQGTLDNKQTSPGTTAPGVAPADPRGSAGEAEVGPGEAIR